MAVTGEDKGRIKMTEAADTTDSTLFVKYLRWVGATTAGHSLVVNDEDGDAIFESAAEGANFIDVHPLFSIVRGITVATMGSGTLYVYVG